MSKAIAPKYNLKHFYNCTMVDNYKPGYSMIGGRAQCGQSGACHGIAIENKLPSEQVCGDDYRHSARLDHS